MSRLLPLLGLLLLTACASTPEARWVKQREAVSTAQDVSVSLHQSHVIDDEQLLTVSPWIKAARLKVNQAWTQLPDGGESFDNQLDQAADLLAQIRQVLQEDDDDTD